MVYNLAYTKIFQLKTTIVEAINIPDPFGDWDTDPNLDVQGHQEKWNTILLEMRIMVLSQLISNMIFIIPFWITGKRK